jgi:hypothetical protein
MKDFVPGTMTTAELAGVVGGYTSIEGHPNPISGTNVTWTNVTWAQNVTWEHGRYGPVRPTHATWGDVMPVGLEGSLRRTASPRRLHAHRGRHR